jgi:hypothetical protein
MKLLEIYRLHFPDRYAALFDAPALTAPISQNSKDAPHVSSSSRPVTVTGSDAKSLAPERHLLSELQRDKNSSSSSAQTTQPGQIKLLPGGLKLDLTKVSANAMTAVKNKHASIPLATGHPMYFAALELFRNGEGAGKNFTELVAQSEALVAPRDGIGVLAELMLSAKRLKINVAEFSAGFEHSHIHSIESLEHTCQIRAAPTAINLGRNSSVVVDVDINLPAPGLFQATLVVDCQMSGLPAYHVPLSAQVSISQCTLDDTSPLVFGRVALGQVSTLHRALMNYGDLPVKFRITHSNVGLVVSPVEGVVGPQKKHPLVFSFCPVDETVLESVVNINCDCTPSIIVKFSGAGGRPVLVFDCGRRLDFGRCMIRQADTKVIKLTNAGNAPLNVCGLSFGAL